MSTESPELLWNMQQICAALGGMHRQSVYRLFEDGAFKKVTMSDKPGAKVYAYAEDVKAYVASRVAPQKAA